MIRIISFNESIPEFRLSWMTGALISLALAACGGKEPEPDAQVTQTSAPEVEARVIPVAALRPDTTEVARTPSVVTYEGAEAVYREGKYDEATRLFETYVSSRPENPWGHYMLGLAAWKSGDLKRAESAFDRALELDPKHVKSHLNSARVLIDLGRDHEALERVTAALALDSTSSDGLRILARVRSRLGDVEGAVAAYTRALVLDEQDVWAMSNLGVLYLEQARPESALPPLARAVQLRPTSPIFQNNLGMALERAGHPIAAKRAYEAAVKADSTYIKATRNLERLSRVQQDSTATSEVDLQGLAELFRQSIRVRRDSLRT
jgi:predicted Zn-dependent protease